MHVRRPAAAVAAVLSLGLGVVGCGGDPPETGPSPSKSTASVSPSPTSTGPVAPELPADAKREDEVGAKAFVRFWFDTVTYAMRTGELGPMQSISADECQTCRNLASSIGDIYADGGRLAGGGWEVTAAEIDPKSKPPYFRFAVKVSQAEQRVMTRAGTVRSHDRKQQALFYAGVEWRGGYQFLGLERIDD